MSNSGVRYNYGGPSMYRQWIRDAGTNVREDVYNNLRELAKIANQRVKVTVETAENHTKGPGRVDSGTMRDALGITEEHDGDKITIRFGWVDNPPPYTHFQEFGTVGGQNNGRGIMKMNALFDGYMTVKAYLDGNEAIRT